MADDLKDVGPRDRDRVNVHEDYEVEYWSRKWGISAAQLHAAVKKVGVIADDVAREIEKARAARATHA
jgi:hypothetical protein